MYIILAGAREVGAGLAIMLVENKHDVVIIIGG